MSAAEDSRASVYLTVLQHADLNAVDWDGFMQATGASTRSNGQKKFRAALKKDGLQFSAATGKITALDETSTPSKTTVTPSKRKKTEAKSEKTPKKSKKSAPKVEEDDQEDELKVADDDDKEVADEE